MYKWNEFKQTYKNNLLTLNLFFIFIHPFFPSIFPLYFASFHIFPQIFQKVGIVLS